ncbi:hypothetical protein GCM10023084_79380 [Streptomyces lacrimifluminis]|uniref:Uncharacterized protein n=1 Tax=Streptomyces lacrimifluminis TaxID=1500077 RepID=A0A917PCT6_9ACTN|nr:hypothetical protein GCM10012282_80040 [Streptomyces lacrimifluminis]
MNFLDRIHARHDDPADSGVPATGWIHPNEFGPGPRYRPVRVRPGQERERGVAGSSAPAPRTVACYTGKLATRSRTYLDMVDSRGMR